MSPFQHGEVFVTEDGAETDLDLGHYERFTDTAMSRLTVSRQVPFIKLLLIKKEEVTMREGQFKSSPTSLVKFAKELNV